MNQVEVQPEVRINVVELGIEHLDDLGALVVHYHLQLLVPQDGDGWPLDVVEAGDLVELPHAPGAIERVGRAPGSSLAAAGNTQPRCSSVSLVHLKMGFTPVTSMRDVSATMGSRTLSLTKVRHLTHGGEDGTIEKREIEI